MTRALITGASSGIGRELALLFARDRADLVLVARRQDKLDALAEEARTRFGVKAEVIAADLAQPGAAAALFQRTGDDVDVLVNNAGFGLYGLYVEQDPKRLDEMVALNVVTLQQLTRLYVEPMVKRRRGRVLQLASTAAFQPGPRMAVYYATKAFVLSFSEALAFELEGTGVTVTALCPGPTASEFMSTARYDKGKLVDLSIMSAADVAAAGYKALHKGERLAVAGAANKVMSVAAQVAPRSLVLAVTDRLTRARGDR